MNTEPVIVVPSLFDGAEFYVFRPIGSEDYKEIKFRITDGVIYQDRRRELKPHEYKYVKENFL